MGKRKRKRTPQRTPVRRIDGGKPHHEERTANIAEVARIMSGGMARRTKKGSEEWIVAAADATEDGMSTTDEEQTAPSVGGSVAQDFGGNFSEEF